MSLVKRARENRKHRLPANSPHAHRSGHYRHRQNQHAIDLPFIQLPLSMLINENFRVLTLAARKALDRIIIEHLQHGGKDNGRLIVTFADFAKAGVRRQSIPHALALLEAVGLIRVERGLSRGKERRPSKYTLTWLAVDLMPPTNDWKKADPLYVKAVAKRDKERRQRRKNLRQKYAA